MRRHWGRRLRGSCNAEKVSWRVHSIIFFCGVRGPYCSMISSGSFSKGAALTGDVSSPSMSLWRYAEAVRSAEDAMATGHIYQRVETQFTGG